ASWSLRAASAAPGGRGAGAPPEGAKGPRRRDARRAFGGAGDADPRDESLTVPRGRARARGGRGARTRPGRARGGASSGRSPESPAPGGIDQRRAVDGRRRRLGGRAMTARFVIVAEDELGQRLARDLADRVVAERARATWLRDLWG